MQPGQEILTQDRVKYTPVLVRALRSAFIDSQKAFTVIDIVSNARSCMLVINLYENQSNKILHLSIRLGE